MACLNLYDINYYIYIYMYIFIYMCMYSGTQLVRCLLILVILFIDDKYRTLQ